jgi:HSP20 family protein
MGLHRDFDRLFDGFATGAGREAALRADVDIEEHEDHFVVRADLPGVQQKDIQVEVHDGVLTLSAKREQNSEEKGKQRWYRERRFGSLERRFRLGPHVDAGKIEAHYKDGVLSLTLPKSEASKPRQIPVSTN